MKYIRTKDGVYKVAYIDIENDVWCIAKNNEIMILPDFEQKSDDVEKLCDEFVIDADYYEKPQLYQKCSSLPLDIDLETHDVYGAIWIKGDKGEWILKTVIKFDKDKKGWELL